MTARPFNALAAAGAAMTASLAAPSIAQEIPYDTGQYQYAEDPSGEQGDDVVTQSVDAAQPRPAERVIPMRQTRAAPEFVRQPVVQGTSIAVRPTVLPAPVAPLYRGTGPVYYAMPGAYAPSTGGASRVIQRDGTVPTMVPQAPPPGYVAIHPGLPAGAQIVQFDRDAWLGACRTRLAGYEPEDRAAALAALGGAAHGHSPGRDDCETYLDSYVSSAVAGTLPATATYRQTYMLVPVTVMVDAPGK